MTVQHNFSIENEVSEYLSNYNSNKSALVNRLLKEYFEIEANISPDAVQKIQTEINKHQEKITMLLDKQILAEETLEKKKQQEIKLEEHKKEQEATKDEMKKFFKDLMKGGKKKKDDNDSKRVSESIRTEED